MAGSSSNSKMLLLVILAVVIAFVAYIQIAPHIGTLWPTSAKMKSAKNKLKNEQARLQKTLNELASVKKERKEFIKYAKGFWIEKRDGNYKIEAQKKIQKAAQKAGIDLSSVGTIRENTVIEGIESLEISISGKGSTTQVGKLFREIFLTKPRFYWVSASVRPDSIRKPKAVVFSGRLRFIKVSDPDLIDLILDKK